jgi:hypothetical protein
VIDAVDRHPDVVQQRREHDHDLRLVQRHLVVRHHARHDAVLRQQPEQLVGDVHHDLDVHGP